MNDTDKKNGLFKLGFVTNSKPNSSGETCFTFLSDIIDKPITKADIDTFIESEECHIEYYDNDFREVNKENATKLRFLLPFTSINGEKIYGSFARSNTKVNFAGVFWIFDDWINAKYIDLSQYSINQASIDKFKATYNINFTHINEFIQPRSGIEYCNGGGFTQFQDGTDVNYDTAKYILLKTKETDPSTNETIYVWFTKNTRGKFEGIDFGSKNDFQTSLKNRQQFFVGRMGFENLNQCNEFLKRLEDKTMDEPWDYSKKNESGFVFPILKSYLEYEVERLFFESEECGYENKIVYNKDETYGLFNTNLIDKFGHDLMIVGEVMKSGGKSYLINLQMISSKLTLKRMQFVEPDPQPPQFFSDVNEIVFHCDWDIDNSIERYEHIIESRIERFPEKYRELSTDELGNKLDNAIDFARRIAQRNYKFIVPMYYPEKKRIQLLMPIYLESVYASRPDFALVLHPNIEETIYSPKTILGLDEVYQDARLIAKPEESWLNPKLI
ncbi:MAG: DUF3825 domain-containing protein [Bacteroidales bacterium]|nr:DUF3825 domain-containing protein [Bacteroidales bacterium]